MQHSDEANSANEVALRRIPLSRRSHIIGFQPLSTGAAEHESALERDFVTLSSFLDPNAVITAQPICISFRAGASVRRYTPDYSVMWSDGRREIVEVKYLSDLRANEERLSERFAAMAEWARLRRAVFRVATERDIRGCVLENAKRLLPLRLAALDPVISKQVAASVRRLSQPTLEGIIADVQAERSLVLATIWRMLARRFLCVDLSRPITPSTRVRLQ